MVEPVQSDFVTLSEHAPNQIRTCLSPVHKDKPCCLHAVLGECIEYTGRVGAVGTVVKGKRDHRIAGHRSADRPERPDKWIGQFADAAARFSDSRDRSRHIRSERFIG